MMITNLIVDYRFSKRKNNCEVSPLRGRYQGQALRVCFEKILTSATPWAKKAALFSFSFFFPVFRRSSLFIYLISSNVVAPFQGIFL